MGVDLFRHGDAASAEQHLRRAVALDPCSTFATFQLGFVMKAQGRVQDALDLWLHLEARAPRVTGLHRELGGLYLELRRFDEAAKCLHAAIEDDPFDAMAFRGLTIVERIKGRLAAALGFEQRAMELNPGLPGGHHVLALLHYYLGHFREAEAEANWALKIQPEALEAKQVLGRALVQLGQPAKGLPLLREAAMACPEVREWSSEYLFNLRFDPEATLGHLFQEHEAWGRAFMARMRPQPFPTPPKQAKARLRIGYLSPDFKGHATTVFFEPLLKHHDHRAFECFGYAEVPDSDPVTQRLQAAFDHFRFTQGLSDYQVAELVHRDGIDILVDLAGHTAGSRLNVMAWRPAPVQAHWLGYVSTTGLPTVDARLSDEVLEPVGAEQFSTERIERIGNPFLVWQPLQHSPDVSELPALAKGFVTFACLSNPNKLSPRALRAWAEILRNLPGSRLVLLGSDPAGAGEPAGRLDYLQSLGLDLSRLTFKPKSPSAQAYLSYYRDVDIILGPFPVLGLTTTLDALFMGVPVLTIEARPESIRAATALLTPLGLEAWVAKDVETLVDLAGRVASDLPALAQLRSSLRARLLESSLCDGPEFARRVEAAYRRLWAGFQAS